MEVGHAPGVRVVTAYPFCVVGNLDKIQQELMQNEWWAICSGDGCHDGIHVDAETHKVDDQTHGTDSSNKCLGLRLMSKEITPLWYYVLEGECPSVSSPTIKV